MTAPAPLPVAAPPNGASSVVTPEPALAVERKLDRILEHLDRLDRRLAEVERVTSALAPVAQVAEAAPGGLAALVDTFDTVAARLAERGVDLDARMHSVLRAVEVSTAPRAVNGLAALIESKLLDPSALAVLSHLAAALSEPGDARPVGAWGLLRALREPDVQRALGFMLGVARELGRHLSAGELEASRRHLIAAATEAP